MKADFSNNQEANEALDLITNTDDSLFITGKAGTGKSTLLRYIIRNIHKNCVVLAPTGIAALNAGGVTIHSFFGLPLRFIMPNDSHIQRFPPGHDKHQLLQETQVVIIDEISMVRADLMDAIDFALRKNSKYSYLPFGGKQIVMFGDLYQLPPVMPRDEETKMLYNQFYDHPFFFAARVFKEAPLKTIELKEVYRQSDRDFIDLLDKIRINKVFSKDLAALNQRVGASMTEFEDFVITLSSTNKIADNINQKKLQELPTTAQRYLGVFEGDYNKNRLPVDVELTLKEGAQVIFVRNDMQGRWVNGTIGKVLKLGKDSVEVELQNGNVETVEPVAWEDKEYSYDEEKQQIVQKLKGAYTQLPLKLAWAITIHKSQGLTFDQVIIDLGRGAFTAGQTYVALSRCRSLEGICLKKRLSGRDIYTDERISQYFLNTTQ